MFPNNVVRQWPRQRPRYYCKTVYKKIPSSSSLLSAGGESTVVRLSSGRIPLRRYKETQFVRLPVTTTPSHRPDASGGRRHCVLYDLLVSLYYYYYRYGVRTTGSCVRYVATTRQCFLPRFTSERVVTRHGHTHTLRGGEGKPRRGRDGCRR